MRTKVLLTGTTGYIGRRLLPLLVMKGYHVICPVRDRRRFDFEDFDDEFLKSVEIVETDFSGEASLQRLPKQFDVAYYLIHSLNSSRRDFKSQELETAKNFAKYLEESSAKQVIYLGGIVNDKDLSQHLDSRKAVEEILGSTGIPLTVMRAGIVIGSGSASFEIIRDLVEKLPLMIAPKWLNTKSQPIAVSNVLDYLLGVMLNEQSYNKTFDIGGEDVLTYREMLEQYAAVRRLKRRIITLPVLTPRLSSLWLNFVTSTSYYLARNLVDSMRNEVVVRASNIDEITSLQKKYNYEESLRRAFIRINQKQIISSWTDSFSDHDFSQLFMSQKEAPEYGCLIDQRIVTFRRNPEEVLDNVWQIGGKRGWYYGTFLWVIRGLLDKIVGGVGLRRGRRSEIDIKSGDSLDFWRVLYADRKEKRLLLFAEMKLPGEAWLEFKIKRKGDHYQLIQTATFRPLGLFGRIYWYLVSPFHIFIFRNMARKIISFTPSHASVS